MLRFHGKSEERAEQDERFFLSTRKEQDVLRVFRREGDFDWWEILEDFDAGGYRFSVAVRPQEDPFDFRAAERKMVAENYDFRLSAPEIESVFSRFRRIAVKGFYAKFVSENRESPMDLLTGFCKTVYEGLDQYGFSPIIPAPNFSASIGRRAQGSRSAALNCISPSSANLFPQRRKRGDLLAQAA